MPFCAECGAAKTAADASPCAACGFAPSPLLVVAAEEPKPMGLLERAAAAAKEAKKQASRLADATITCRQCGIKAEAGHIKSKFCIHCGVKDPSAASVAASVATGAMKMAQKGMLFAAEKLDGLSKDAPEQQIPQAETIQPPPHPPPHQPPLQPPRPPPAPCPACPECKGKGPHGCPFCPEAAQSQHQLALER